MYPKTNTIKKSKYHACVCAGVCAGVHVCACERIGVGVGTCMQAYVGVQERMHRRMGVCTGVGVHVCACERMGVYERMGAGVGVHERMGVCMYAQVCTRVILTLILASRKLKLVKSLLFQWFNTQKFNTLGYLKKKTQKTFGILKNKN